MSKNFEFVKFILIVVYILTQFANYGETKVTILRSSNFPHAIKDPFIFYFKLQKQDVNKIILIIKRGRSVKNKIFIDLNKNGDILKSNHSGLYFENITVEIRSTLQLVFTRFAIDNILEIYENSKDDESFTLSNRLFRDYIDLTVPAKLEISSVNSIDEGNNQYVTVKCVSHEGTPYTDIHWNMLDKNNHKENVVPINETRWNNSSYLENEIYQFLEISFLIEPNDDKKSICCISGEVMKKIEIIFHKHPDRIKLTKSNPPNYSFNNGDILKCQTIGDRMAMINYTWNINDGPSDSSKYIKIHGDSKELMTVDKSPEWSTWNITCLVASTILSQSTKLYKSDIVFLVKSSKIRNTDSEKYSIISYINRKLKVKNKIIENMKKKMVKIVGRQIKSREHFERTLEKTVSQFKKKMIRQLFPILKIYGDIIEIRCKQKNTTEIQKSINFVDCYLHTLENADIYGYRYNNSVCILYTKLDKCILDNNGDLFYFNKNQITWETLGNLTYGKFSWRVGNIIEKRNNTNIIYSDSFYSHPYGYKLKLRMDPNGYGDGQSTHLSLFFILEPGQFDAGLQWPSKIIVRFSIVNPVNLEEVNVHNIHFSNTDGEYKYVWNRPTKNSSIPFGIPKFVSWSKLQESNLIKNNTIHIKCKITV